MTNLHSLVHTRTPFLPSRFIAWRHFWKVALVVGLLLCAPLHRSQAELAGPGWPQVQANAQHSGYSPETVPSQLKVIWTHPFQPEKVYPQVQPIIGQGLVFVGTEMGNLYALDANDGTSRWVFRAGAPLLNSVAYADGRVFFGAMDGAVYAIDAASGQQIWRNQASLRLGFSAAPVIADGKVMLGGRNGVFYALEPSSGQIIWQYRAGAPLLQTAAADGGKVIFGAMNLRVIALNTVDGALAWQSDRLNAMAFKDYWPVIAQGRVIERPTGAGDLISPSLSRAAQARALAAADAVDADAAAKTTGSNTVGAQAADTQTADEIPHRSLYLFDLAGGQRLPDVVHWDAITMNGAAAPPCVDRDGLLIVSVPLAENPSFFGWGRLNPATRQIQDSLIDARPTGEMPPPGFGNIDENMALTCAANAVLAMHTQETNAQFTGIYDYGARSWTRIEPGHASRKMSQNAQGGGASPAAIANGKVYHISWHELIVRAGG